MLCKLQTSKKQKKKTLKTTLTDFSRKEKAAARYTRIYIKLSGRDNTKQAKSVIFIMVPRQKQKKFGSEQWEKIVMIMILMIVTKLIITTIK